MTVNEDRLFRNPDAQLWAKEWCKIAREIAEAEDGREVIDEGWMIGWFANAMITAVDAYRRPTFFDDVKAFHQLFNLPVGIVPKFPEPLDVDLRLRLIREEVKELEDAHEAFDMVEVADAIADLIYVACGMAVSYGIPLNEIWAEVQRSNMAKVGDLGKPIYREDGKVLKPAGWIPPNVKGIIDDYR